MMQRSSTKTGSMKTKIATILGAGLLSASAQADIIGGTVEVSYWFASYSGDAVSGNSSVDLENEFGLDDTDGVEFAASFEHPVPLLPNIKVKHITLDETENGNLNSIFEGVNGAVETELDLTHSDVALYYEVLDNYVSIDLGLNIKIFDGELNINETSGAASSNTDIDEVIPMLYGAASVELPFTGLSVGAELSGIGFSGDSLLDGKVRIRQDISLAFVELGYRQLTVDIEDVGDVDVDFDLDGAYLSVGLDF